LQNTGLKEGAVARRQVSSYLVAELERSEKKEDSEKKQEPAEDPEEVRSLK
jgi:hypothetical protein